DQVVSNDFKLRSRKDDCRGHNPRANEISKGPETHVLDYGLHGVVFSRSQGVGCPTKKEAKAPSCSTTTCLMDRAHPTHAGRLFLPTPHQNGIILLQVPL
ncbi:unnamed protein product, partial [Discosporangium mesarthrocarpum]